jgi:hypothetical protein
MVFKHTIESTESPGLTTAPAFERRPTALASADNYPAVAWRSNGSNEPVLTADVGSSNSNTEPWPTVL